VPGATPDQSLLPSPLLDGLPFTRDDARGSGLRPELLPAFVRAGLVRHVVRGVYLDAQAPDDVATRAACLRLRLPPGAVVSRLTAAWLWGVDGRMPGDRNGPVVVECTVPAGRQPLRYPGVRSYVAPLEGDVCELDGIPVTTAVRTAVDALRWLRPHMALGVADALAHRGLVTPQQLTCRVEDFAGCSGVRQARHLARLVEPGTESFGESWLRLRVVDAGFPRPRVQIEIVDGAGRVLYRLDLGWDDVKVAVEYDGDEFHSTPEQLRRDRRRRDELENDYGWQVLPVGKGEVLGSSMALEKAIGELLGRSPRLFRRRW